MLNAADGNLGFLSLDCGCGCSAGAGGNSLLIAVNRAGSFPKHKLNRRALCKSALCGSRYCKHKHEVLGIIYVSVSYLGLVALNVRSAAFGRVCHRHNAEDAADYHRKSEN